MKNFIVSVLSSADALIGLDWMRKVNASLANIIDRFDAEEFKHIPRYMATKSKRYGTSRPVIPSPRS